MPLAPTSLSPEEQQGLSNRLVDPYIRQLKQGWEGLTGTGNTFDQRAGGVANLIGGGLGLAAPALGPLGGFAAGAGPAVRGLILGTAASQGVRQRAEQMGAGKGVSHLLDEAAVLATPEQYASEQFRLWPGERPDFFYITNPEGVPIGHYEITGKEGGHGHVNVKTYWGAYPDAKVDSGYGPDLRGYIPKHVQRQHYEQLARMYPTLESVGGYRISGAREAKRQVLGPAAVAEEKEISHSPLRLVRQKSLERERETGFVPPNMPHQTTTPPELLSKFIQARYEKRPMDAVPIQYPSAERMRKALGIPEGYVPRAGTKWTQPLPRTPWTTEGTGVPTGTSDYGSYSTLIGEPTAATASATTVPAHLQPGVVSDYRLSPAQYHERMQAAQAETDPNRQFELLTTTQRMHLRRAMPAGTRAADVWRGMTPEQRSAWINEWVPQFTPGSFSY